VVVAAGERLYLAQQVAALRISLARRDAEVARLTGGHLCLIACQYAESNML
jgi:hypothetical protein